MQTQVSRLITSLVLISFFGLSILSSDAAVAEKTLISKLTAAKIVQAGAPVVITSSDAETTVAKHMGSSPSPDTDCKIEAVMIAKTIMDADPSIKRVKTQFYSKSDPTEYSSVSVGIGDIKAFGSGAISTEDLMKSLELNKGSNPNPPLGTTSKPADASAAESTNAADDALAANISVVDGPLLEQRKKLLVRINRLKKDNVNTTPYETYFAQIEETAKQNSKFATSEMVDKLSLNVESQEKALLRKKAPPVVSSSTNSQSPLPLAPGQEEAGPPMGASGGGYSIDDLKGFVMGAMAARAPIMKMLPSPGPFYYERGALVRRWYILGKSDSNLFYELERDAKANNRQALADKLKAAFAKYNVGNEDFMAAKQYLDNKDKFPSMPQWGGPQFGAGHHHGGHHRGGHH